MRLAICCSKNWFKLAPSTIDAHIVKFYKNENDLTVEGLVNFKPDYVFFTHWGWIVPKKIHAQFNCILFHAAPLPYGRGGSPIQNLILEGFKNTPVCAVKMTDDLDAGPIYTSSEISLDGTLCSIFFRLNKVINKLIVEIIEKNPIPSVQLGKSYTFKRLASTDNMIQEGLMLEEIYDRIRMVDHEDYPKAYIVYGDMKLEFSSAELVGNSIELTCSIKKLK